MGRKIVFLLLCLLGLVLLVQPATAVQPTIPTGNCDPDGLQSSGAIYRICVPGNWNGDLIVYAHGYVSPPNQLVFPKTKLLLAAVPSLISSTCLVMLLPLPVTSITALSSSPALKTL
jgi:hypothetical protein